jgi:hypothetical protein
MAKQVLPEAVGTRRSLEEWGKSVGGLILCKDCIHMDANEKMKTVRSLFQKWGKGEQRRMVKGANTSF